MQSADTRVPQRRYQSFAYCPKPWSPKGPSQRTYRPINEGETFDTNKESKGIFTPLECKPKESTQTSSQNIRRKLSDPTFIVDKALQIPQNSLKEYARTSQNQRLQPFPSARLKSAETSSVIFLQPSPRRTSIQRSSEDGNRSAKSEPNVTHQANKNKQNRWRRATQLQRSLQCSADSTSSGVELITDTRRRTVSHRSDVTPNDLCAADSFVWRKRNDGSDRATKLTKKTRRIKFAGYTYKLTMKPHAASDDEAQLSQALHRTYLPEREETTRSEEGVIPLGAIISLGGAKRSPLNPREMEQAQKWVSERENLARSINLSELFQLPNAEDECNGNNVSSDSPIVLPAVDTAEALDCAALRLRRVIQELENGNMTSTALKDTFQYAISVLEMKFLNRTSYSDDDSDADATLQGDNVVPPEIKRWLMQTFSTSGVEGKTKQKCDRRSLRSVVHVVQAGIFVERMFRKSSSFAKVDIAPEIREHVKDMDKWQYDVFELDTVSGGNALKYTFFEVLCKFDFIRKFKISTKSLFAFCDRLQAGYRKYSNRYHNPIHAADVTQCISVFLTESGFANWLSDLEVFAIVFAAAIHDYEHTGTTNAFHTKTRSELALLYNDQSVLENHHASSVFRILWEDQDCDILFSLCKADYTQFRELIIEMVLSTDMSLHFGHLKNIKSMLQHPEKVEKAKAMSLMMHCADISHPTRPWEQHHRWTERLLEEFFEQGDKERELQVPISPLSDRHTTNIPQSQIGFIDYVIKPTFDVLHDLFWKVTFSAMGESASREDKDGPSPSRVQRSESDRNDSSSSRCGAVKRQSSKQASSSGALKAKITALRNETTHCMKRNRQKWVERDREDQQEKQTKKAPPCSSDDHVTATT